MRIPLLTANRPLAGIMGEVRYNADTNEMQTFDGTKWRTIGDPTIKLRWQKWFAWRPVKVKGRWVWWKSVYRYKTNTYVNYDNWARYEYGDIFDVLKAT